MPSGVSLETAANFLLFPSVAMRLGDKILSVVKTDCDFHLWLTVMISSYYEGKEFSISTNTQVIWWTVQYRKATIYIIITVNLFLLFIRFLAGNIIVYTPNQGTNREKYFNHIIYEEKDADFGGK